MNRLKNAKAMIVVSVILLLFSVILFGLILSGAISLRFIFLYFIIIPVLVTCIAYVIYDFVEGRREKDSFFVVPLVCFAVTIISLLIGLVDFLADSSFILRGLGAEMIWFFVTLPSFIATIIQLVIFHINAIKSRK